MNDPRYVNIGRPQHRLIEERGELVQAICRAERFGRLCKHSGRQGTRNMNNVLPEIQNVRAARDILEGFLVQ